MVCVINNTIAHLLYVCLTSLSLTSLRYTFSPIVSASLLISGTYNIFIIVHVPDKVTVDDWSCGPSLSILGTSNNTKTPIIQCSLSLAIQWKAINYIEFRIY